MPASSSSSTSCQRLGWREPGDVGVRQLVDQDQRRLARQRRVEVELRAACGRGRRTSLQRQALAGPRAAPRSRRGRGSRRRRPPRRRPAARAGARRLQHGVGLADAGRRRRRRSSACRGCARCSSCRGSAPAARRDRGARRSCRSLSHARGVAATALSGSASSARLSCSTFTRGSPRKPNSGASRVLLDQRAAPVGAAGRAPWRRAPPGNRAAARLMCGSRPLPEAVTRSTGTGAVLPGSAARSASMRALDRVDQRRVQRPWLEPPELPAL